MRSNSAFAFPTLAVIALALQCTEKSLDEQAIVSRMRPEIWAGATEMTSAVCYATAHKGDMLCVVLSSQEV
jgi:4-hydroxy-3-methylbut-2-enyl diphosphate reductase IspH